MGFESCRFLINVVPAQAAPLTLAIQKATQLALLYFYSMFYALVICFYEASFFVMFNSF